MTAAPIKAGRHWAYGLIGKPWFGGTDGPDTFDCRGLVRHVWLTRRGMDVRPLAADIANDAAAIIHAAVDSGWQRMGRWMQVAAREFDVVMMTGAAGPHVGVIVRADMHLGMLHAVGYFDAGGAAHGSVIFSERLESAAALGYGRFELWRHA